MSSPIICFLQELNRLEPAFFLCDPLFGYEINFLLKLIQLCSVKSSTSSSLQGNQFLLEELPPKSIICPLLLSLLNSHWTTGIWQRWLWDCHSIAVLIRKATCIWMRVLKIEWTRSSQMYVRWTLGIIQIIQRMSTMTEQQRRTKLQEEKYQGNRREIWESISSM